MNADGPRSFSEPSTADAATLASPTFSSTYQDESTSGAGVVHDTDAREMSSDLPPTATIANVAPSTTSATTNITLPPTTASSSKFTLSIPLLGRPKVPLGSVLGKEKEKGML